MTYFELIYTTIFFACSILYTGYKISKLSKTDPEIIDIKVIDNKAQWVYDNKIYYADVIDGKINNKTMKRIEI
jgi:hypothetical protein